MDRVQFTIAPLYNGWQVRDGLRSRDWFVVLDDAVASANTMALALHALTGRPTGVLIDNGNGQSRVCREHGD